MSKSKTTPGKKFRAGVNKGSRDRNWTNLETDAYTSILADGETNYALTLETKALKRKSNKEVFEAILTDFNVALADSEFCKENKLHFPEESMIDLDISVDKLRVKYNNLKKLQYCPRPQFYVCLIGKL